MLHYSRKPKTLLTAIGTAILSLTVLAAVPARAETSNVRIAYQYGFQYVPLLIMKHQHLLDKYAKKAGISDLKVTWLQLSGGTAMGDALLSGNLDFGELGVAPFVLMWAKTNGTINVKAVSAVDSTPMVLTTNDPSVKTVKDFSGKDRIALPAVKSSMEALALEFEAAKIWGKANYNRLDKYTVAMKHPDGATAMISKSGISAHFTVPPFSTIELSHPYIHKVIDSHQIFGGRATQDVIYATQKFRDENPKTYHAFLAALTEAISTAEKNRKLDAKIYIEETKTKLDPALVAKVLDGPEIHYSNVPNSTLKLAQFMAQVKIISNPPSTWKEMFFPDMHDLPGS